MAVPQPDYENILASINEIRSSGHVLTSELPIKRIQKSIESIKGDYVQYNMYLGSLYCITGDVANMRKHVNLSLSAANGHEIAFNIITLCNAGFYSESRVIAETLKDSEYFLDDNKSELNEFVIGAVIGTYSLEKLLSIMLNLESPDKDSIFATHEIMQKHGIDESTVLAMLDIAGEVIRDHKLLRGDIVMTPSFNNEIINLRIPVKLPASEMVLVEWDFITRLVEKMPNAPLETVHIGFSCQGYTLDAN